MPNEGATYSVTPHGNNLLNVCWFIMFNFCVGCIVIFDTAKIIKKTGKNKISRRNVALQREM